ncbi:NAD-dependent epimerase/dehydratase family protein [Lutibaculum baratangense]|uniref:UDP-glucose 4-epimerase n=1 Tax=Lutibaculum baratangense AMV1 TaxID=631454 RepID=V4RC45_9HYPH|nr:NAD(P)-dependent oxidoreductase [Lutibaculum baratangense]ESR23741.1 UDP-glucose 4-epimerase [Lutibaculum baratangense AMV1]
MDTIMITGAAGRIATVARRALRDHPARLRLVDLREAEELADDEEMIVGDCADLETMRRASEGVDCVIHLAGIPTEAPWEELLPANYVSTYNAFEAARLGGAKRFIFASSNHAVGYHDVREVLGPEAEPRPDGLYGVAKVFGEALGRLYSDRHGLEVCSLRIGSFRERPLNQRELATWISPRDMGQLIRRCVDAPPFRYFAAYGVSANRRRRWTNGELDEWLGYRPEDDAEIYAAELSGPEHEEGPIGGRFHGGPYCDPDFKGSPRPR